MQFKTIYPISSDSFEATTDSGKNLILDKVEFAIHPKENIRREIQQGIQTIISGEKDLNEKGLLKYADFIKHNDFLCLVRESTVKELFSFEPQSIEETIKALLMVLRVIQAFHSHNLVVGGLSYGQLKKTADGEVVLQDPRVLNYLSKWLADQSYKLEMAPEIIKGGEWGPQTDIFAWGLLAYKLLTGQVPYNAENSSDRTAQILRGRVIEPKDYQPRLSNELNRLIVRALDKEPSVRPDIQELISSITLQIDQKTYEVSEAEAEQYRTIAENRRKKSQSRDKLWLWFRKYGTVTLSTIAAVIIGYFMFIGFKAKPVLTPNTTPLQVVNYYFEGIRKIDVPLVAETVHRAKNSLEDIVANVHVMNVQRVSEVTKAGDIRLNIENLRINKLSETPNEVKYKVSYVFRAKLPKQDQLMEREDIFTLKPVRKIWRITSIKVLKEQRTKASTAGEEE